MKRLGIVLLAIILLAAVVLSGASAEEQEKIYIAMTVQLSGSNADSGRLAKEAADFWVREFNAAGGFEGMNADLELITYDVTSTADQSRTILERALTEYDFAAVYINCNSAGTLTQMPVCERAGIPAIMQANSEEIYTQGYMYTFSVAPKASETSGAGVELLQYLNENGYDYATAAILYEDTSVGASYGDGYRQEAEEMGLEIVYDRAFQPQLTDASSIAQAVKASGAEVILGSMAGQDSKIISEAFAAIDYHPLWMGVSALVSYGDQMGAAANGQIATTNWVADTYAIANSEEYSALVAKFEEEYGHFVAEKTGATFSALDCITRAIEIAGTSDHEAIREVLATEEFDAMTSTGKVKFDETGYNVMARPVVGQWQNGVCVGIYPTDLCTGTFIDPSNF